MLQQLGLREGVYYHPDNPSHMEARRTAQQYVRGIYGSHRAARRLHYVLWEKGYVWSDQEVYTVKVHHYLPGGEVGVQILDKAGREELYSVNPGEESATVETYTALPSRHIDKRREETYHHRPAGIY